ncbi:MAG: STAS domain-containing protein [Mariprofundaceae bacterium]|nr:STAS domain-containing protein [Mariprofundaceae bacterium]
MSDNQGTESTVIGHDPLAWIAKENDESQPIPDTHRFIKEDSEAKASPECTAEPDEPIQPDVLEAVAVNQTIALAEQAATGVLIVLEGDVGIANVNTLHAELRDALQQASKVTIQAKDLSHVDTAAAQLLYAFDRDAKKSEIEVSWQNFPETCLKTLAVIGLSDKMMT